MSSKDVDFKVVDLILSTGTLPKESRNDPVFHECIHELSALPMYRLSSEPSYLRDCHRRIIEENYKLACDNYSTFIQTAECTKKIFEDFEMVEKKNETLINKIPNFVNSSNNFVEKCRKSISMANMNSLTLKNHNQILDILDIPQLLEACIRNNYLDEALEVIAHTRKLERRHQNVGIIMNVAHESRLAAQKLLDQLFQQLGGNLQLPACLKIIGYLRRMDCLPDSLLRLKFLQCRDNYLKNLLRSLPTNDAFFHATKYMEITRVNLFDIATQYRAVFNDDDIYMTNTDTDSSHQGMLFSSWLVMRVRSFMVNLCEDLELIVQNSVDYSHATGSMHSSKSSSQSVGSKLQSLLGQSMYFGLSLSRIGSDFRGLLMPMFYQAILKYIDLRLNEIPDSFIDCISSYKWTVNIDNAEMSTVTSAIQTANELLVGQKSEEILAPNKLMNHPLLAMLVNQLLSILEDIRLCCPRVLKKRICQSFTSTIEQLMNCLVKFHQDESPNFSAKEQQLLVMMIHEFVCVLLPHVNLCLTLLFATDVTKLANQKHSIDIARLSRIFVTVLPESFFLSRSVDEDQDDQQQEDSEQEDGQVELIMKQGENIVNEEVEQKEVSADQTGQMNQTQDDEEETVLDVDEEVNNVDNTVESETSLEDNQAGNEDKDTVTIDIVTGEKIEGEESHVTENEQRSTKSDVRTEKIGNASEEDSTRQHTRREDTEKTIEEDSAKQDTRREETEKTIEEDSAKQDTRRDESGVAANITARDGVIVHQVGNLEHIDKDYREDRRDLPLRDKGITERTEGQIVDCMHSFESN